MAARSAPTSARAIPLLAAVVACLIVAWLLWPAGPIVEMKPASSVRLRSAAIEAYEDRWWASAMEQLGRLCSGLAPTASASYGFIVFVEPKGRIIRVDVRGTSFDATLASRIEQVVRATTLPPFTPQQEVEKKTLGLRGNLFIEDGKCKLQRT